MASSTERPKPMPNGGTLSPLATSMGGFESNSQPSAFNDFT